MIWLTWRQFRTQAVGVFAALAALAIVLAVTGPNLADEYASGIAACTTRGGCSNFTQQFFNDNSAPFLALIAVVMLLPALIGIFWGAPLIARELEAGTHRLVWNQSVTRTRWLTVKLALIGLAAMAAAGLGSLVVTWWSSPIDKTAANDFPRMSPLLFDARGIAPIGYAAFAFALGVTVGMLIRRALPAMAITLAVFAAVQIAMPLLARPHFIPPIRSTVAITASNMESLMSRGPGDNHLWVTVDVPGDAGAWVLANETVDVSGRVVDGMPLSTNSGPCAPSAGGAPGPDPACFAEMSRLGYRQQLAYQPASRFWPFQWIETGIYTALTLGLAGFCFWWTRRRLS
jgi:hypothetical protein